MLFTLNLVIEGIKVDFCSIITLITDTSYKTEQNEGCLLQNFHSGLSHLLYENKLREGIQKCKVLKSFHKVKHELPCKICGCLSTTKDLALILQRH